MGQSVFDKRFKQSGFPQLLAHFGEPVIYVPLSGGSRPINAIIERSPPDIYEAGKIITPSFVVRVLNDCTDGIVSTQLNIGGDQMKLIAEIGDTRPTTKTILKKLSDDSSVVVLALR